MGEHFRAKKACRNWFVRRPGPGLRGKQAEDFLPRGERSAALEVEEGSFCAAAGVIFVCLSDGGASVQERAEGSDRAADDRPADRLVAVHGAGDGVDVGAGV